MDLVVTGRKVKITEGLRTHIRDKVIRLGKYDPKLVEAKVVLAVEKFRHMVEITLKGKHLTLKGEGKTNDLYSSDRQFPSIACPPRGFGRSRTTTSLLSSRAASMHNAMV